MYKYQIFGYTCDLYSLVFRFERNIIFLKVESASDKYTVLAPCGADLFNIGLDRPRHSKPDWMSQWLHLLSLVAFIFVISLSDSNPFAACLITSLGLFHSLCSSFWIVSFIFKAYKHTARYA